MLTFSPTKVSLKINSNNKILGYSGKIILLIPLFILWTNFVSFDIFRLILFNNKITERFTFKLMKLHNNYFAVKLYGYVMGILSSSFVNTGYWNVEDVVNRLFYSRFHGFPCHSCFSWKWNNELKFIIIMTLNDKNLVGFGNFKIKKGTCRKFGQHSANLHNVFHFLKMFAKFRQNFIII